MYVNGTELQLACQLMCAAEKINSSVNPTDVRRKTTYPNHYGPINESKLFYLCSCAPYLKKGFKRLVLDSWKTRFLELRGFQIGDFAGL